MKLETKEGAPVGTAAFEYTVVELAAKPSPTGDRERTELINSVAAHGWRLIAVSNDPGQYAQRTYGYFERPVQQS